ncbi:DUF1841 family protein [Parasulfuritortus cantonensis]|uniref:DUF1841 family protein n=1 Tax=Parasulfuritortus cantonensis TaxID=2528202 RepID=A0A4R1BKT9_9PROT|nr:DUF1841 family protein [Parasulfuritortus cantonensis]TCJ18021.1 DUF1841 family protein [Parasulfuritortus cantonensis]
MFNPSRDQARQFLFEAWRKHRDRAVLTDLEAMAADHILRHPEYHALLADPDAGLARDWLPEQGETNPFLHLMMHLSIGEQLSIDQPEGVRALYLKLAHKLGDEHRAQHEVMDCLAEMIWTSQRYGAPPDGAAYLACLEEKSR